MAEEGAVEGEAWAGGVSGWDGGGRRVGVHAALCRSRLKR